MAASRKDEETGYAYTRSSSIGNTESEAGSESESKQSSPSSSRKRKRSFSESTMGVPAQERWDEMFDRLKAYKAVNGHCNVPNRYPKDPQLGFWVSTQRRQYRVLTSGGSTSSALTVQRAQRLINLGFEWSAKDPRMVPWETRYDQLCDFVAKYNHAQVPIGWEDNVPLSNWVSKQRQEYKLLQKGRPSRLTPERINKLNKIGFVWEAKRGAPRQLSQSGDDPAALGSEEAGPNSQDSASNTGNGTHDPHDKKPVALARSSSGRAAGHGEMDTKVRATHPTRGMGPMSPPASALPASQISSLPPGRLLLPPTQGGYPYRTEPTYHGIYPPVPPVWQDYYYPPHHHQAQPHYQSMFPPPPHPHAGGPDPHSSPESYNPNRPPHWNMPQTGRVLTPLYPIELPAAVYQPAGSFEGAPREYDGRETVPGENRRGETHNPQHGYVDSRGETREQHESGGTGGHPFPGYHDGRAPHY